MKRKKRLSLIAIFMVCFMLLSPVSADMNDYLDNVKSQLSNLNVNAYQGQQRGYYMGGSARIRVPNENIQPLSFTPPSVKAGCGGIDIVMGGYSYLNFEYLVQKLQSIMQTAPAFAFELALATMCPECKNIMDSLEAVSNQINALNVDSCQASKALVGYAGSLMGKIASKETTDGSTDGYFSGLTKTVNDFSTGYQNFLEKYTDSFDCSASADPKSCMAAQGKISLKTPLLDLAFTKVPDSEANYMWVQPAVRAFLGDVAEDIKASDGTQTVSIKYIKNCTKKINSSLAEALMEGKFTGGYLSGSSGAYGNALLCSDYTATNGGFAIYVSNTLKSIRDKIKAGTVPTADEIKFINSTRVPIYGLFSKAVIAGKVTGDTTDTLTDGFIDSLAWPLATDLSINTLEHLSSFFAALSVEMMTQEVVSDSGSTALKETIKIWQDTLNEELQKGYEMQTAAWSTAEHNLGDIQQRYQELQRVIYTKLAENKLMDSYVWARGAR